MSCSRCQPETVAGQPITRYQNIYHPRLVNVVHPIEIVRRHHCVPVVRHCYTYTVRDEFVD